LEFVKIKEDLWDHRMWNFLDEKHMVNKDVLRNKVRADPLTGRREAIPVSGDFRDAHNIFAVISGNPLKSKPMEHLITKNNGTASEFVNFIVMLLASKWFKHNEVLCMDNARIHTAEEAGCVVVEDLLWDTVVDGRPLHVVVVCLPTRSPEHNPIECIFHILAARPCLQSPLQWRWCKRRKCCEEGCPSDG